MSHLNLETLARLIDEAPDPTEAGHLDICEPCRTELESLRADASALHHLPDPEPAIAAWLTLEQRLKREGLVRRSTWVASALRTAAVLFIFVLGSVVGGLVMRQQTPRSLATITPMRTTAVPVRTVAQQPLQPLDTQTTLVAAPVVTSLPAARPAANLEEASARLRDAERAYLSALSRYSEFTGRTDDNTTEPVARLAALESIVATTRAALSQAPADPVINGYHLTAVAQRDATLRQLAASKQQTWY
ncbi:MAG TPA: hypothetical protein VF021_10505 [Longimicrobiales bacterium]